MGESLFVWVVCIVLIVHTFLICWCAAAISQLKELLMATVDNTINGFEAIKKVLEEMGGGIE